MFCKFVSFCLPGSLKGPMRMNYPATRNNMQNYFFSELSSKLAQQRTGSNSQRKNVQIFIERILKPLNRRQRPRMKSTTAYYST